MFFSGASKPGILRALALRNSSNTAGSAFGDPVLPRRGFGQRADVAHFLGEGDRVGDELAFDEAVDEPAFEGLLGADRLAGRAHLERLAERRQRAAGAGFRPPREEPQLDLGRAEFRATAPRRGNGSRARSRARRRAPCRGSRRPPASSNFRSCRRRRQPRLLTGGLPNSVMSAPAKKVWPSQAITTALTLSSASACSIAATSP